MLKGITGDLEDINLSVAVSKVNMTDSNPQWWVDTATTMNVFSNKEMFYNFKVVDYGEILCMVNSTSSCVKSNRSVIEIGGP